MDNDKKDSVEKTIGYFEVFYYDEDTYQKYHIGYYNNEEDALDDFLSRSYAGVGDHNLCFIVGHGPSFKHICMKRTICHNDTHLYVEDSYRFKED